MILNLRSDCANNSLSSLTIQVLQACEVAYFNPTTIAKENFMYTYCYTYI